MPLRTVLPFLYHSLPLLSLTLCLPLPVSHSLCLLYIFLFNLCSASLFCFLCSTSRSLAPSILSLLIVRLYQFVSIFVIFALSLFLSLYLSPFVPHSISLSSPTHSISLLSHSLTLHVSLYFSLSHLFLTPSLSLALCLSTFVPPSLRCLSLFNLGIFHYPYPMLF